ncbi:MAG: S-layer homology domain-containing protein [Clostridia bacterium]|nr:S-layer homology domain-containing protein [Clostridia bacterium]
MMKKTMLMLVCAILVVAQLTVSAASFPDVDSTKYSWAISEIEEMANLGIINGFEDGTFGPAKSVTRVDSLLLASRILGTTDKNRADYVESAFKAYAGELSTVGYDSYVKTLSFLLYNGTYTPSEIRAFLSNSAGGQALKRHEAAVILTKLMGAEAEVKANTMPVLSYSDTSEIPVSSRAYVEYCETAGLMQGMEDGKFSPMTEVTRAQMAVMLNRVMKKLDFTSLSGVVSEVNNITNSIKFIDKNGNEQTVNVMDEVILKLDSEIESSVDAIASGYKINVVYKGEDVYMVESIPVYKDEVITGMVSGKTITSTMQKISVRPVSAGATTTVLEYILADECVVLKDGVNDKLTNLQTGDFVTVTVKDSKAILISSENKEKTVSGVISEFIYEAPASMSIKMSNNQVETYELSSEVTVKRNGKESDVASLLIGDKVTVSLLYDRIKTVTATSSSRTVEGTIEEILISASPEIKINTTSGMLECALSTAGLEITVNDEPTDVYGLKLGYTAKVTMESSTITKIAVSSVATNETVNVVGTVNHVDTNYMFISLTTAEGVQEQIFVKKNASIIDSTTQKTRTLASIKEGSMITAVIASDGFTPEAVSIVVLSNPQ